MIRAAAFALVLAACGSSETPANPSRLWLDTLGAETTGMVQLVPFQPTPF